MDPQLDPGYETGEIPRRPDSPLDAPWRPSYMQPVAPVPQPVVRAQPTPQPRPAEMREYRPTTRERDVAKAQSVLEGLGMERAGARRAAQTVLGGPQSSLPLGVGLADIPLLPALPYFMEEGYRSTERAAGALERGDYGTAALEYLGAVGQMLPGGFAAREVAPGVAKVLRSAGVSVLDSMGANAVTSPMARGQRGVFLPEVFFTPQEKAKVTLAQELEAKGTSPDEVRVQTGLVRDLDGSWAVELSDDKMQLKALEAVQAARAPVVQRISDIEAAMQVRDILDAGGSMGNAARTIRVQTGQEPSPRALELARQRTPEQLEAALENANNSLMAPIRGLKMKDVVEHPELFARLPELAEMQVDFVTKSELGGALGHFDPEDMAMRLQSKFIRPGEEYGRSVAGHELQHSIDYAARRDYGTSPESIKSAGEYWKKQLEPAKMSFHAEATALQARRLMDSSPGMTPEQALDEIVDKANYYGTAEEFGAAGRYNPENEGTFAENGILRDATIRIIRNVPFDAIKQRVDVTQARLSEAYQKARVAAPTEAGRYEQYMTNQGEARARLVQTRLDLTPEERLQMFPMREQFMGLDRPPESLKTAEELTGGLYGRTTMPAVSASQEPPAQMTLREALADQPTTLRTLENLPGKRTMIPMQEIRDQLRRPEVTKAERDVFERVLGRTQGGSISAENLVREVGLETKDFTLTPKDTDEFADYGLQNIGRETDSPMSTTFGTPNAQNARTTIHRSPTPTATNNHFGDPNYFGHTRAFEADGIPHVVEIQSDLVQKAGKELAPEERTALQQGNAAIDVQRQTLRGVMRSDAFREANFEGMAAQLEQALPILRSSNPDAEFLIGEYLSRESNVPELRGSVPEDAVDNARAILSGPASDENYYLRTRVARAVRNALDDFDNYLNVRKTENEVKLAEKTEAAAQRPMFKNWERRLIREELSRAATPQPTPEYARLRQRAKDTLRQMKDLENYSRSQGLSESEIAALTMGYRTDAEYYANLMAETPQFRPIPPVVRFADADTVALVEGWKRKVEFIPGEAMDFALRGRRVPGTNVGTSNDWELTGRVRMDADGAWEMERVPVDVSGRPMGASDWAYRSHSVWTYGGSSRISQDIVDRFVKLTDKFEYPEHQGIYDRYKKEVTNYLKSLGGKQVKDQYGHSWWEVPVKPEQKRTQIFSMGGGAVAAGAAATYNADEEQ